MPVELLFEGYMYILCFELASRDPHPKYAEAKHSPRGLTICHIWVGQNFPNWFEIAHFANNLQGQNKQGRC